MSENIKPARTMLLTGLTDYHMHTTLCGHASGTTGAYVRRALAAGLDEIGFSEHIYLYHLPRDQRDPELAMKEEDMDTYVEMVDQVQHTHPEITIRLGLEADYIPKHEEKLASILASYPWDYIYGSVHFINRWGFDDPRYIDKYSNWQIDELYTRYFELVMDAARAGLFDVMAHLDLIKKFGYRTQSDLQPLYAEVAGVLAESNVCIEISSGGLRQPISEAYPHPDLLRACYLAGVPVTLGSDAHKPEHVGYAFPQLVETLRQAGYSQVVRFAGRVRTFHALPELAK